MERERSLILRLLTRRIGELPERIQMPIAQLTLTQLEALGEALLEFTTMADLITWLLTCRCGELSAQVMVQISHLTQAQMEALGEVLLGFVTIADLESWLQAVRRSSDASE